MASSIASGPWLAKARWAELIFVDDLGYGDIGPFGNRTHRTPHLDRLAAEGMKVHSFYATPVCSMSRAALLTGCYNVRVSLPGVLFPDDDVGLNPAETTVAEVLAVRGYATACIGKWHLGHRDPFLPTAQGFGSYFGIPYSNDMTIDPQHARFAVDCLFRDGMTADQSRDALITSDDGPPRPVVSAAALCDEIIRSPSAAVPDREFRRRLPTTRVIILGILPVEDRIKRAKCQETNRILAGCAYPRDEVVFLDVQDRFLQADGRLGSELFTDGTHLSTKGYEVLADALQPVIERSIEAGPGTL